MLSFKVSGVTLAQANTDDFKEGVRVAIAKATTPPLSLKYVGAVTISAGGEAATASRRELQSSSGASSQGQTQALSVSTRVSAPASTVMQTVTAATLTTQLRTALPSLSGLSATTPYVEVIVPTFAPTTAAPTTKKEDKDEASSAGLPGGITVGLLVGGGIIAAIYGYLRSRRNRDRDDD